MRELAWHEWEPQRLQEKNNVIEVQGVLQDISNMRFKCNRKPGIKERGLLKGGRVVLQNSFSHPSAVQLGNTASQCKTSVFLSLIYCCNLKSNLEILLLEIYSKEIFKDMH